MKGVVLAGDRKVEILDLPDPSPGPSEVVLEIKSSGMCGSDLKYHRAVGGAASPARSSPATSPAAWWWPSAPACPKNRPGSASA